MKPSPAPIFRLSLGHVMGATAFVALVLAATVSDRWFAPTSVVASRFGNPRFLFSSLVRFATVAVCAANRRLSRGMWLVIIGEIGPWITGVATTLAFGLLSNGSPQRLLAATAEIGWACSTTFSALFALGLAVTFRDVRRRLEAREAALLFRASPHPGGPDQTA